MPPVQCFSNLDCNNGMQGTEDSMQTEESPSQAADTLLPFTAAQVIAFWFYEQCGAQLRGLLQGAMHYIPS